MQPRFISVPDCHDIKFPHQRKLLLVVILALLLWLLEFVFWNLPWLMQHVSLYVLPSLVPDAVLRCEYEGLTVSHHYGMLVLCNKPTLITY